MAAHCSGCVFTVCVVTVVCVHFGWVNAEHKFWVWVTILGRMSRHFHIEYKCVYMGIIHPHIVSCHTYVTASVTSSMVIINTFSQWRHPTYSVYFLAFPDYGFYSGPGDQRCAPCSFADYAALGPHTGQMLQSEHVTSTCNSPSQHHPSPDHFKSSGVYGMFCPRHVLLLKLVPSDVLGNTSSFFLIPNVHEYPSIWVHTLHAESCSPSFFCLSNPTMCIHSCKMLKYNEISPTYI